MWFLKRTLIRKKGTSIRWSPVPRLESWTPWWLITFRDDSDDSIDHFGTIIMSRSQSQDRHNLKAILVNKSERLWSSQAWCEIKWTTRHDLAHWYQNYFSIQFWIFLLLPNWTKTGVETEWNHFFVKSRILDWWYMVHWIRMIHLIRIIIWTHCLRNKEYYGWMYIHNSPIKN